MSVGLLVVAMVAAVNPFRSRLGLHTEPVTALPLAVGIAAGVAGVAVLALSSPRLLEALQISPETFLIAAGLVAIVAGARTMFFLRPFNEPPLPGWREGLWPIAFPRLLSPEVMAVSLALVSQRGAGTTVAAAAVGVGGFALLARARVGARAERFLMAWSAVTAVVLIAVGTWMMIEGIRDV